MKVYILNTKTLDLTEKTIDNDLVSLQTEVDGYIQPYNIIQPLVNGGIELLCNEGGQSMNLKPSVVFCRNGSVVDLLYGNLVFVGVDKDKGTFKSLTKKQIDLIKSTFTAEKRIKFYLGTYEFLAYKIVLN